jgi:hypothetical protein
MRDLSYTEYRETEIAGSGRESAAPILVAASAALYSIVSTARANGLEPYAYLRRLFTELPKAKTVEDFEALLPFNSLSGKAKL